MRNGQDSYQNEVSGIIRVGLFFFFTILIPFLRIGGGFLWGVLSSSDYTLSFNLYWDRMAGLIDTVPYQTSYQAYNNPIYSNLGVGESIFFIWLLIPLWSLLWLGLGTLGAVLVTIPPLLKIREKKPINIPLGLIGLIIGLLATFIEVCLFLLLFIMEDWGDSSPHINLFIFGCTIFGWISLVNGYRYPRKMIEKVDTISAEDAASIITLEAENIYKYFGGVRALQGASVLVTKNKLVSLIGPNGCGKTTLFNVITSWLPKTNPDTGKEQEGPSPEVGSVRFEDKRIDGLSAHETALTGMMRTFQTTRNWANLTVLENLLVAPHNQTGESLWKNFIFWRRIREDERKNTLKALEVLEFLEITHIRDQIAQELSGGQLKLLALGRLLMSAPRLILLDEPMAGINPTLGNKIMDKIVDLKKEATVFLIEHNMDVVFNYSDEIFVMASGKIIAQGTPNEIETNREVIEAYLGKDY